LGNVEVKSRRCIDIGSGSVLAALGLKQFGADYVATQMRYIIRLLMPLATSRDTKLTFG